MYRSMCRSIYLSIYLSIYPSIHLLPSGYSLQEIWVLRVFCPKPQEVGENKNAKEPDPNRNRHVEWPTKKPSKKGVLGEIMFFVFFQNTLFDVVCFFLNLPHFVSLVFNSFEPCWFQLGFASNDQRDQSVHLYYARCSTIFLKTPKHTKTMSITSSSLSSSTSSTPMPPQPNQQPPTVWTHVFLPKRYHHSLHHPNLSKANTKGATVRRSVGIGTLRRDTWNRCGIADKAIVF